MASIIKKKKPEPPESQEQNFIPYDDYWLQKGRKIIDGGVEIFENRLKSLNNFLNYLAAGTFLGGITYTTYLESTNITVFSLFVIPLIFIALAKYAVSIKGSKIVSKTTDMRSPNQINKAYHDILEKLSDQVQESSLWVAVATGFVLVCIPIAIYFQNMERQDAIDGKYLVVQYAHPELTLTGHLPEAKKLTTILYGKDTKKEAKIPITRDILIEDSDQLSSTFDLKLLDITLDSLIVHYQQGKKKIRATYRYLE